MTYNEYDTDPNQFNLKETSNLQKVPKNIFQLHFLDFTAKNLEFLRAEIERLLVRF